MNEDQITLVQESFAKVAPITESAAGIFYADLFATAPEVRPLFKGNMDEQGMKLMTTLGVVVKGLRDFDKIVPVAEGLAVRHVAYGVEPAHYDAVGASLLRTLEQGLGSEYTPAVDAAWRDAYATLATVMKAAAYGPEAAQ